MHYTRVTVCDDLEDTGPALSIAAIMSGCVNL